MTANAPPNPSASGAQPSDQDVVLVVDLDGTLCRTDTLHEAVLGLAADQPVMLAKLPGWLSQGKAAMKDAIAAHYVVPGEHLPLNPDVIAKVEAARAAGRRTALVTASDQRQADLVADTVGMFDEVHGSRNGHNLKGPEKAQFLIDRYGAGGFDYIGDSQADLAVWKHARRAVTVQASPALRRAAEAENAQVEHIAPPKSLTSPLLRALRPHQWSKNVLLFLPLLASHDLGAFWAVLLGFLAFCCTASAVYVINDLFDLAADRAHPRKRLRPFAAGELTAMTGLAMVGGLLALALIFGLATGNPSFLGVLAVYLGITFAYSLSLKRKLLVDVLTLAALYTIRIVAGGVAASLVLSPWLLGFSMFLFLGLAAVKRQAELMDQLVTGRESSGRAYQVEDLPILRGLALSSGMAAVLVLALYIASDDVQLLYDWPEVLWLVCPIVLYWVLRMVMTTHRGHMTDDPIVFAAKDRTSQLTIVLAVVTVLVAAFA
ncbi:UbiA family prenyltransferase [Gymnodinialimonas sp. 2305UL16-5]|uniref:UbiA family prenyltransferase n=1 Tax=Gymnodinialimonas mytili TaxID=3126503 RepID=UPI0030AC73F8